MLPCAVFDPLWLYTDKADSSFSAPWGGSPKRALRRFFLGGKDEKPGVEAIKRWLQSGVFAYHLHNSYGFKGSSSMWDGQPEEGSWFHALEIYFEQQHGTDR